MFSGNLVKEVSYHPIHDNSHLCYLSAKVAPSMKTETYQAWVCVEKDVTIGQEEKMFLPIALAQQGKTGYPNVLCLCFACKACCSMFKHVFCCSVLHVQVSAVSANRCSWINMLIILA